MWELDCKERWVPKNWCFWTVVLKTLESPLDCKEIQPVHPEGHQSWVFIGRTDAEAETLVLWPPDAKSWLIWKDPNAGKVWRKDEKGMTEDEMAEWHHQLNGHGFGWTPGIGDIQGGLVCCSSWGHKESDTTEWLKWTELIRFWGFCMMTFVNKTFVTQTCHLVLRNFFLIFLFAFLHGSVSTYCTSSVPESAVFPSPRTHDLERHSAHGQGIVFFDLPLVLVQWTKSFRRYFISSDWWQLSYVGWVTERTAFCFKKVKFPQTTELWF